LLDLTWACLIGANLTGARLRQATLTNVDASGADLRGAENAAIPARVVTRNMIAPDGRSERLVLDQGEAMRLRDFDGAIAIVVDEGMTMDAGSTLRLLFEDEEWGSTIHFVPSIDVQRGGTLELLFADGVDASSLIGTAIDLFYWSGANPQGTFAEIARSPGLVWDTSVIHATGQVTLLIPEPSVVSVPALGATGVVAPRRWAAERAKARRQRRRRRDGTSDKRPCGSLAGRAARGYRS
jgi:hypothetical protein